MYIYFTSDVAGERTAIVDTRLNRITRPNQTISARSLRTRMGHPAQRWFVRRCTGFIVSGAEIELCN